MLFLLVLSFISTFILYDTAKYADLMLNVSIFTIFISSLEIITLYFLEKKGKIKTNEQLSMGSIVITFSTCLPLTIWQLIAFRNFEGLICLMPLFVIMFAYTTFKLLINSRAINVEGFAFIFIVLTLLNIIYIIYSSKFKKYITYEGSNEPSFLLNNPSIIIFVVGISAVVILILLFINRKRIIRYRRLVTSSILCFIIFYYIPSLFWSFGYNCIDCTIAPRAFDAFHLVFTSILLSITLTLIKYVSIGSESNKSIIINKGGI